MPTADSARPVRILHLEDSDADHELAQYALADSGLDFRLVRATALPDFMARLANGHFDVVLADFNLPGFTALDAWAEAGKLERVPPFVLLSSALGDMDVVEALRRGISDYVRKDDLGKLGHVIVRAIEARRAREARERSEAEMAEAVRRSTELSEYLQSRIEEERTALARDVHDEIGGALAAVKFDLAWIQRHTKDAGTREHVNTALEMLRHAIDASQRIVLDLRPPILDQGLVTAIDWLARNFEKRTGVATTFRSSHEKIRAPDAVQLTVYRTAQEALTNVSKHADCRNVEIELSDAEGVLTLEVADDGRGLTQDALDKPKAFGLKGLVERARVVDGWLDITNRHGIGTAIILSVPLKPVQLQLAPAGARGAA
ncbi:MAG: response regulator [Burkholderiaceae bacterium]|nr:response regulator [Burkholderiaceae bacterium]